MLQWLLATPARSFNGVNASVARSTAQTNDWFDALFVVAVSTNVDGLSFSVEKLVDVLSSIGAGNG